VGLICIDRSPVPVIEGLVIWVTLRLHTPVQLLLPQKCHEPCQVLRYYVPRGTQVLVNTSALGRDERYWPDALEVFRPERFVGEAGAAAEFRGTDRSSWPRCAFLVIKGLGRPSWRIGLVCCCRLRPRTTLSCHTDPRFVASRLLCIPWRRLQVVAPRRW
jgi:hypothetical protein